MKKLPRKGGHRSAKQDRRKTRFSGELVMLYEDDAVVALNKPAGLSTVL
jgi:23S rRNA-/tRNA-specific pseudouridylate synthase